MELTACSQRFVVNRNITSPEGYQHPVRNIDSDAPSDMRQELNDLFFYFDEHNYSTLSAVKFRLAYKPYWLFI